MSFIALVIGVIVAVVGCMAIEHKKTQGQVVYPLWRGNLFIPWGIFLAISLSITAAMTLPHLIKLTLHGASTEGTIAKDSERPSCSVAYRYSVRAQDYTGSDDQCGLKAGDKRTVYYETENPENSTLYFPRNALRNEIMATALICLCLSTFLVLWFRLVHVIGSAKKP